MKRLHLRAVARLSVMLLLTGLLTTMGGCRGDAGAECLTDSDCDLGLLCIKRTKIISGETYEERLGTCYRDDDNDTIPDDGDLSGSNYDRRCGVRAIVDPDTGAEVVYEEVIGKCDDNCVDVANTTKARRFVCFARDECCPISQDRRDKMDYFRLCEDVTDQADSCAVCLQTTSETCYTNFSDGVSLDENGCIICKEQERVACDSTAECYALMPTPACSGDWQCTAPSGGFCKFVADQVDRTDGGGYSLYYQKDSDRDGLGDECDNCEYVPNGINCEDPTYEFRCDVNLDGVVSLAEKARGNQLNEDGDRYGDACDLCIHIADDDNRDFDLDGLGNPCDPDDDNDGAVDEQDNCPEIWNPNQNNMDDDEFGDECDFDYDGDGVREDGDHSGVAGDNPCTAGATRVCDDNCPGVVNTDQADSDGDGIGDACD